MSLAEASRGRRGAARCGAVRSRGLGARRGREGGWLSAGCQRQGAALAEAVGVVAWRREFERETPPEVTEVPFTWGPCDLAPHVTGPAACAVWGGHVGPRVDVRALRPCRRRWLRAASGGSGSVSRPAHRRCCVRFVRGRPWYATTMLCYDQR
jgi:hypothetical protein